MSKTEEQIVEELAALNCASCNKHGVYYHCAIDGNHFCKECWPEHLRVHPQGGHLD